MQLDKRVLLGSLGVALAVAVVVFKYNSEPFKNEVHPRKAVARPVMQHDLTTEPSKKVVLAAEHSAVTVDWNKEFQTSTDYFPLIARAAKAGLKECVTMGTCPAGSTFSDSW
jgi:hypothetical protein